mmetsp:Transcript_95160/g.183493  ORF Transcript_95160/g.183493 Transcript_95160/m.183493 type:complete len:373 (-) Transcript_95160:38-1156(-)
MADVSPELKGFGYSPFSPTQATKSPRPRIGVPGYGLYPQNIRVLCQIGGSSFESVFKSPLLYVYLGVLAVCVAVFASVDYKKSVIRGATVPSSFAGLLVSLDVFTLTFFIGQCFSEANARFENVCKTNGNITRLSALAGGLLPRETAFILMRYTNAIMHIYYLMLSGPLDEGKWSLLQQRGLLTDEEIRALQLQGSPAVVLYTWAIKVLRNQSLTGQDSSMPERVFTELIQPLEEQIGGARGLAAKQIAYTITQIPCNYFHVVYFAVNILLACTVYDSGHMVAVALDKTCFDGVEGPCEGIPRVVMIVITEVLTLVILIALLQTAEGLADIYGNKQFHYDLGFDLDNLWQESQNVLKSMATECPTLKNPPSV